MKKMFDSALQLKDSAAITASAAAQVGGAAKVIDLGANSKIDAKVVHVVTAINNTATANKYTLTIQGSTTSAFSSSVKLAETVLGHATAIGEASARGTGTYEVPFTNSVNGTLYRYVRLYLTIAGSPVSITSEAFITKAE